MGYAYIAAESMGAVIILILLYANIYELKQYTRKSSIFTRLLLLNEIVVLVDLITWLPLGWKRTPFVLGTLILFTYIIPFFVLGTFSRYIFEHISEKTEISRLPFKILSFSCTIAGFVFFILCITGKMFKIRDGKYCPTELENVYYLFYIFTMLFISVIIFAHRKKLGLHDLIGALSFCLFPLISFVVSILQPAVNLAVAFTAINTLVIYILLQSEREDKLFHRSIFDEQTGLYNRSAYEEILQNPPVPADPDLVYASVDINGLKQMNDTLGHAAGDELILGTATCLKHTFRNRGKVYRIGGDEFAVLFHAGEQEIPSLMEQLLHETDSWQGQQAKTLSISIGSASLKEFPTASIDELSKISDKRMYADKELYYSRKGIDRRGKALAHTALCNLYTKILKINLTTDTYTIINIDPEELTGDTKSPAGIFEWLESFGSSGLVHPDDLKIYRLKTDPEYLKKHFREGKKSISIFYRRRYPDGFKEVIMEMIPADDYAPGNQSLFLYVKTMDL